MAYNLDQGRLLCRYGSPFEVIAVCLSQKASNVCEYSNAWNYGGET
jgi:hypothetical protein